MPMWGKNTTDKMLYWDESKPYRYRDRKGRTQLSQIPLWGKNTRDKMLYCDELKYYVKAVDTLKGRKPRSRVSVNCLTQFTIMYLGKGVDENATKAKSYQWIDQPSDGPSGWVEIRTTHLKDRLTDWQITTATSDYPWTKRGLQNSFKMAIRINWYLQPIFISKQMSIGYLARSHFFCHSVFFWNSTKMIKSIWV